MPRTDEEIPVNMIQRLVSGDVRAAARLITMAENCSGELNDLMKQIYPHTGKSTVIGITGPGGAGKSSLINQLICSFRKLEKSVAVIAVDPSSPFSGGAVLGDRLRFQGHTLDKGVYLRSIASRGYLGGLARATTDVVRIMEAMGKDVVIIETLGVGQDEIDIVHLARTCVLVLTPAMGDDVQAIKAGIMEIADIIVLNKFDLDGAESYLRNLEAVLSRRASQQREKWAPRVIPTISSCTQDQKVIGIDVLIAEIDAHQSYLKRSRNTEKVLTERVEQELRLMFKNEAERLVFAVLERTGKKQEYIDAITMKENDPYSAVEEVLRHFLRI